MGAIYPPGWTESVDFPTVVPEQGRNSGSVDAFVIKLNPRERL
jgi:hypothetical protein